MTKTHNIKIEMEIVMIGTGNTATVLGRMLKKAGHRIVQVFGRDPVAAGKLAIELETGSTGLWNYLYLDADLYILAVSDVAISGIITELRLKDKIIVHTAASVSKDILKSASNYYGVLYPLQSLKKEIVRIPEIPIIVDASDEKTCTVLIKLARSISNQVVTGNDEQRLGFHLAAVFCNNFINHLYALAERFCRTEEIDFNLLLPLIKETALRVNDLSPSAAQTGPAIRQDTDTIEKHLTLLKNYPQLTRIYTLLTESIFNNR